MKFLTSVDCLKGVFLYAHLHYPGSVLCRLITMQIVGLLVMVFAMLVMLGVPKDHKGPHATHRLSGLQKSHWCKQMPNNPELHRKHQTLRRFHKCSQIFHSKYKTAMPCNYQLKILTGSKSNFS